VPIPRHSKADLEKIADSFLAEWGTHDGKSLLLEHTIEKYGLRIWSVPHLAEIAEAYVPVKEGYLFVDEEQYLNPWSFRIRFTLTEELAHTLIHRQIFAGKTIDQIKRIQAQITDAEYAVIERDAKYLAGAILMKKTWFMERFGYHQSRLSFQSKNRLNILGFIIRELSRDFNVSCYTAAIRARELDLIDQQILDDIVQAKRW
jgi:Zn-dependent peptidase ImmA (M78 family)